MRLAIGRISDGELEFAEKICRFVREIYRELTLLAPSMDDSHEMRTKMDTMLQSVVKIENGMLLPFYLSTILELQSSHLSYMFLNDQATSLIAISWTYLKKKHENSIGSMISLPRK